MARAQIEVDHAAQAAYIDFGVESRGVASAVEVSPTVNVDLDRFGMAVGIELLSLSPDALSLAQLREKGCLRDEDARLVEDNLPAILEFLAGSPARPAHPGAQSVDCFYLAS